jgi:hypothetical protein
MLPSQIEASVTIDSSDLSSWASVISKMIASSRKDEKRDEMHHRRGSGGLPGGLLFLLNKIFCPNPLDRIGLHELECCEWLTVTPEEWEAETPLNPPSPQTANPILNLEAKGKGKKKKRKMDFAGLK